MKAVKRDDVIHEPPASDSAPGGDSAIFTNNYNGAGTRVSSVVTGGNTQTDLRAGVGQTAPLLKSDNSSISDVNYVPGISEKRGSTWTWNHSGLKNVDAQTQASPSATSATRTYDAFGNVVTSTGSHVGPFGYGGKFGYQEDAVGYKLLGDRWYDPEVGRFLTRDRAHDGGNWYAYCENNPLNSADPLGATRLIVLGDRSGGVDPGGLASGISMGSRAGDVVLSGNVTVADIIAALLVPEIDEFLFYGHGGIDGELILEGGEAFALEDLLLLIMLRNGIGLAKLRKVVLNSCWSARSMAMINAWLQIAEEVTGYVDVTASWTPPRFNPTVTLRDPVTRDLAPRPGVAGDPKHETGPGGKKGRKREGKLK